MKIYQIIALLILIICFSKAENDKRQGYVVQQYNDELQLIEIEGQYQDSNQFDEGEVYYNLEFQGEINQKKADSPNQKFFNQLSSQTSVKGDYLSRLSVRIWSKLLQSIIINEDFQQRGKIDFNTMSQSNHKYSFDEVIQKDQIYLETLQKYIDKCIKENIPQKTINVLQKFYEKKKNYFENNVCK
ncbi:hypothetical protein ABPG74_019320 [Tetrahymena malaccensis]